MQFKPRKLDRLGLLHRREQSEAVGEDMAKERERFEAIKKGGPTRAVSSFNLFQTPADIADIMASRVGDLEGLRVLEPSAGLGRIVRALHGYKSLVLVEQAAELCGELYRSMTEEMSLICGDFLERAGELGTFDRVVMNPPFKMGRDVKHILKAAELLTPGGLLVSLCFNGSKQNKILKPWADTWEVLPEGSFKAEGTRASVALLTYRSN